MDTPDSTGAVFEYNAPQFLSFTTPVEDDEVDKFFDTVSDIENGCDLQSKISVNESENVVTSSSSDEVTQNLSSDSNARPEVIDDGSAEVQSNSSNPYESPLKNQWDRVLNEANAKIQEAKATASARAVKRAFAPRVEFSEEEPNAYKIVAVDIGHPGIHLQPARKCTTVQPFSFEERHKRLQKEKEEKIKKFLEEERKMREFHANPLPRFTAPSISFSTVMCTDPKEFKLKTEERIQDRKKNKAEIYQDEQKIQHFKARPATVLQKPPFEPKKADCPLTDVTGFHLNTEERARKREEFNMLIKQKEAELEFLRLQRKKEEEKALAEEIKRMRKEAVHKANPAPVFKPVPPIFSTLPLTEPKSPCFASRKLAKVHKH